MKKTTLLLIVSIMTGMAGILLKVKHADRQMSDLFLALSVIAWFIFLGMLLASFFKRRQINAH